MTAPRTGSRPPRKIFHKIGEVCDLTQTEPYVLRYWESEFPFLAPEKNRAGQRIYTDEDIETVLAIKRLLYEEGYTTAGARRRLEKEREDRASGAGPQPESVPPPEAAPAAVSPSSPGPKPAAAADVRRALREAVEGLRDIQAMLIGSPTGDRAGGPKPRRGRK